MILENAPGINIFFDFSKSFSTKKPLNSELIFQNPRRKNYGFYWVIDSGIVSQTIKYRSENVTFSGFYVSDDEEAAITMSLFNRVFYNIFVLNFNIWESQEKNGHFRMGINSEDMDKIRWNDFYSLLKMSFSKYYIPFRKFLAFKRPDKCWISFSNSDVSPQDPIYLDFLCGIPSLEFKYPGFIESEDWRKAIGEGPLENPEKPIVELFFHRFSGSIKFAPKKISEKFKVDHLQSLSDFGII